MQRISVDLPEPEGPQTTIRSPFDTASSISRNTWNSPYHLLTLFIVMIGWDMVSSLNDVCGRHPAPVRS